MKNQIPNPQTKLAVIKRFLHILALLQNNKDQQNWNANTLADVLSLDENEDIALSDKSVRDYIKTNIIEELKIDVSKTKGGIRTELADEIEKDLLLQLINVYATFVTSDQSKEAVLKKFINNHPYDCLWIMARLYFASIEKKIVEIDYISGTSERRNKWSVHPYFITIRNNNIYLIAHVHNKQETWLFILNNIENIIITNEYFKEEVPTADEIFKHTLGSYIRDKAFEVKLKFDKELLNTFKQIFILLEPEFTEKTDYYEVTFKITDDVFLCKQLFQYGKKVKILEPDSLRQEMINMLKNSLKVYE